MTIIQWMLGWILVGMMMGFGLTHGWWLLFILSFPAGVLWWYLPDWLNHPKKDHKEDNQ